MREKPRDKQRLHHIIEACNNILEFSGSKTYEEFMVDKMLQFAVIKNFEIIGEAAYHLTDVFRKQHSFIPWDALSKFRHVLVHDYYNIDLETVWRTIQNKLPELKIEIENLLKFSD